MHTGNRQDLALNHHQNSMFAGGSYVISGGTFDMRVNNQTQVSSFDSLSRRSSLNAAYNALGQLYDQPKCHPDTRVSVLRKIKCWTQGFDRGIDPTRRIMWLRGAAGAGKTAIAHDIAEWCDAEKQGLLLASFFFWRTDSTRNEIKLFIPTLAYAITQSAPTTRSLIVKAVESDPHIFSRSLEIQLLKLVLEPLAHLSTSSDLPHVIIVDGLDECVRPKDQKALLDLFVHAFTHHKPGWRVLITSRPEQAISNLFDTATLENISTVLDLDREYDSHDDIRRFLVDNFKEIKETHPRRGFTPSGWPGSDAINQLVRNASGQFIYAKTVINYIKSDYDSPVNRLKSILDTSADNDQGQEMPFAELDSLYTHILSSTRVADAKTACRVVACCIAIVPTLRYAYQVGYRENWRDRYRNPTQTVANIFSMEIETLCAILGELRSIIHFTHTATRFDFKLLHASFEDFIFDPRRSGDLYVDRTKLHASIACSYFRLLQEHSLVHLKDLCRTLYATQFHASCFTVTSITPELAKYLSLANFIPILDKIRNNHRYYAPYFPPILAALKDMSQDFENGIKIYQKHVSAFDEWCACQLEDYLQQSSALKSLVAFFPSVHDNGDVRYHDDDIQYDFDHLQLLGKPSRPQTNWYLLALSDLPRTRLVVQNGEANAAAALAVIHDIDLYTWLTCTRWNWQTCEPAACGLSIDTRIERAGNSLERLPMLLNRAAYSSDLINALPFNTVRVFDKYSHSCHESWCAVRVAIKSYLNRHGVSLSSEGADYTTWNEFVAILNDEVECPVPRISCFAQYHRFTRDSLSDNSE